eukprot:1733511-Rhodomonas_salina.3
MGSGAPAGEPGVAEEHVRVHRERGERPQAAPRRAHAPAPDTRPGHGGHRRFPRGDRQQPGHRPSQICPRPPAWLSGCMATWVSGCRVVGLSGCLAAWLLGRVIFSPRLRLGASLARLRRKADLVCRLTGSQPRQARPAHPHGDSVKTQYFCWLSANRLLLLLVQRLDCGGPGQFTKGPKRRAA